MVEKFSITIPPISGDQERNAYIYLPQGYEESDNRYPVIYMFDGHNLFFDSDATYKKSWGLKEYLDNNATQIIVVGIECNHFGNNRLSEYSPFDFTFRGTEKIKGRGKKYLDWLVKTLKPFIDENYKTLPSREYTSIAGSSMGGLMTLYALTKYGKYFSKGAALSPSLWVKDGEIKNLIEQSQFKHGTILYMDYGSKEFKNHTHQREFFGEVTTLLMSKGVNLTSRIVPDGTHSEASWERQIPLFMSIIN